MPGLCWYGLVRHTMGTSASLEHQAQGHMVSITTKKYPKLSNPKTPKSQQAVDLSPTAQASITISRCINMQSYHAINTIIYKVMKSRNL